MTIEQLSAGLWRLRLEDAAVRGFIGEQLCDSGTVTDTYLLKTDGDYLLSGSMPADAAEEWLDALRTVLSGGRIGWFLLRGGTDDRKAADAVLSAFPDCVLVGAPDALYRVDGLVAAPYRSLLIRGERRLAPGGREIRFTQHGAALSAVDVLSGMELGAAPEPAQPETAGKANDPTAAIVFAPGEFTPELAEQIAAGIRESGPVEVGVYDLSRTGRSAALRAAETADAVLFGTPETALRAAKAVYDIVTSLHPADCRGKLSAVFWSGLSADCDRDSLRFWLGKLGYDLNTPDFFVQGKPDAQMLRAAYEYGYGFGCSVQRIPNPRRPKLMKCLVCGEIFDASLGICPVCGVGLEQCVPVDGDEVMFRRDSDMRYVILGGGIAAVSAAEAIRSRDGTGSILMISAEPYLPINRPQISKEEPLTGDRPELPVHGQDWYDERGIALKLGCRVTQICPETKTVVTDGGTVGYDRLIYALGGECFMPPFPGRENRGVLTLRYQPDGALLDELTETAECAVVIGGGVIGLEAASKLMRAGVKVTVLEAAQQILEKQIDADTAAALRETMASFGVPCYENVQIEAIEGDGTVSGVRLSDGRVFPADIVVVSCGIRANTAAASACGMETGRGVIVNAKMETNLRGIWACGDCAELHGVNYQLWAEAGAQGRTAGANAAGDDCRYAESVMGLSMEGFGTVLYAIGDAGRRADVPYRKVELRDGVRCRRETYWFFGDSLCGAVLLRSPEKTAQVTQALNAHARYDELF